MTARIMPDAYTRRFTMSNGDTITGIGDGDKIARMLNSDRYGLAPQGGLWTRVRASGYRSQAARDVAATGRDSNYADYLEQSALEHHAYYLRIGNPERAALMLTRSLGEALAGNDGI